MGPHRVPRELEGEEGSASLISQHPKRGASHFGCAQPLAVLTKASGHTHAHAHADVFKGMRWYKLARRAAQGGRGQRTAGPCGPGR